jgi:hypothetical protein
LSLETTCGIFYRPKFSGLKSDVSINKEALLLIETSLLRLGNLGRWKPHVEFLKSEMVYLFELIRGMLLIEKSSISLFNF